MLAMPRAQPALGCVIQMALANLSANCAQGGRMQVACSAPLRMRKNRNISVASPSMAIAVLS